MEMDVQWNIATENVVIFTVNIMILKASLNKLQSEKYNRSANL